MIALSPDLKVSLCGFRSPSDRTTLKIPSATSRALVTLNNALRKDKTLKEFLPPSHLNRYWKRLRLAVKEWLDDEDLFSGIFGDNKVPGEEEEDELDAEEGDIAVDDVADNQEQDDPLYVEEWNKAMTRYEERHRLEAEAW